MVVEYKRPRHCEGIVESLYLYKQHGLFCDATLVVDDDQIGVHRLVLCHGSPYFTSIFDSRYSDDHISQVLLHNVDLGAVHSVVNFLYTGGENDKRGILNSTIIYLIDSDKWVATTKMRYKRSGHGSCIINGQIYVAGGHNGETILNTAEKFEPDTELWMTLAPMNMERCWLGVASTGGHMFAAGGYDGDCVLDSVEVFLPDNNKWSYIAPMCLPRERLGMCAIKGTVYAIGGRRGRAVADCEVYDQRANAWRKISPLLAPRDGMGCVVSDKYIYAIGGFSVKSHSLTVERFVQKKNLWERVCPMTRLHDLAAVVAT